MLFERIIVSTRYVGNACPLGCFGEELRPLIVGVCKVKASLVTKRDVAG